jgi:hypothetical protein
VRPTFFCAGARDPSGSLGGPPLNAADGPQAARLLERCAVGPQLLTEVERPVFVALDNRLGSNGLRSANCGKFKLDDGMSDSECDQPFVLSRVAAVADD